MATEQQPMLVSYYWLEEAYRMHSETLNTVIIDISTLRSEPEEALYHKAFDGMELSTVKIRALKEYVGNDYSKLLAYLIPFISYHDRWSSLSKSDFEKYEEDPVNGSRGYCFFDENAISSGYDIKEKNIVLNTDEKSELKENALYYFDKIVNFCSEKGIKLILIKTPTDNWSSGLHNAAEIVANEYGLNFYDFNFSPLYEELEYIHAFDTKDGNHLNYYGASKLTDWIGTYLTEECDVTDVRGNEKYLHMEMQSQEFFTRYRQKINLQNACDVSEYLDIALEGDNTIFIEVKDDAAGSLTDLQREYFFSVGLKGLSELKSRNSYLAVIENKEIIYEEASAEKRLSYSGTLRDGSAFSVESGGFLLGDIALCNIDGVEYSGNSRGINITVYSNELNEVIDSTVFDTFASATRESVMDLKQLK